MNQTNQIPLPPVMFAFKPYSRRLFATCNTCKFFEKRDGVPVCKLVKVQPTDKVLGAPTYASCYDERSEKGSCAPLGFRYKTNTLHFNTAMELFGLYGVYCLWPVSFTPTIMQTPAFIVSYSFITFSWASLELIIHYHIHNRMDMIEEPIHKATMDKSTTDK
jgi:hypothetical protein